MEDNSYFGKSLTHFCEYQLTDPSGVKTWERCDPTMHDAIFFSLSHDRKHARLKIENSNIEVIFDMENGNHRHRDVKTGSEGALRITPEVIVNDWDVFKVMVDVSKITMLALRPIHIGEDQRLILKVNDADTQEFMNRINVCESLRILDLSANCLTDVFGVALGKAVATHKTLVKLVLDDNKFGEETGVALGQALTTNRSLHTLKLNNNELRDKGGGAIMHGVKNNTTLRVLYLRSNELGENFGVAIQDDLANNTALRKLYLGTNDLGDKGGASIIRGLKNNTTLRVLFLIMNNLGEKFGVAIQDDLANNTGLHTLDLRENGLGEKGGVAIIRGLRKNTTLRLLVLKSNNLGENFGGAIEADLARNTGLRNLSLGENGLGEKGGVAIIRGLKRHTTLRLLSLAKNNLGENFGVAIQNDLANNTVLHELDLCSNLLGDTSGVAMAKALTVNTTLTCLRLYKTNLGEESGTAFADALTQNSTLTELVLTSNDAISPATQAKIKFALSLELKSLLDTPSVCPSRIPVCVVGFDNVGKTELVNTWHRTTAHDNPHLDPDETARAKSDDERDKTSGISIKPVTLRLDTKPPFSNLETPSQRLRTEEIPDTVAIVAWDFAGHTQYFLSHELLMRACRGAVFVLLFRIDSLQLDICHAEEQRLFFWLKFIASIYSNQQQPTVFIGGTFRPDGDSFDVDATTVWTDSLLHMAKEVFDGVLNLPQQSIYHMDCRKSNDPHVTALRNALAKVVEEMRTRDDRKVPPICEHATRLLHNATQEVTSKLLSFEEHMKSRRSNPNMPVKPLSWLDTMCGPIMTRANFEEHILGKLEVKADGIDAEEGFVDKLYYQGFFDEVPLPGFPIKPRTKTPTVANAPTITPKSKQLLQILTAYLHDVGDILWFDVDGLRDTVILTPDLFCSKIIGAIFRPNTRGFSIDAVHGGGELVPKSSITATFQRALGIDGTHVDAALAILCQLGLCHKHQDGGKDSYLFPGALATTSYRRPEWFGPLAPGQYFVVGRRFTLVDPTTTIFAPGCMPAIQVWALGRYKGSTIWHDGVIIPYTATGTLAEAGIQLHRPYSSSQDGGKCAQVSMSSITLVVRGSDAAAQPDCLRLLNELCGKIRATSGTELVEESLPPNKLAQLASNNETNMLDASCPGYVLSTNDDDNNSNSDIANDDYNTKNVANFAIVDGNRYTDNTLRNGAHVEVSKSLANIPFPPEWVGDDFRAATPGFDGGVDLTAEVTRGSPEFIRIETNMHNSLPSATISKIERVQNKSLWAKYCITRSDVAQECVDQNPNEIEAWHGTGGTDPRIICGDWKAGFDVLRSAIWVDKNSEYRNHDNKVFGVGVYLANHAIYSDTIRPHARPEGTKQLILARVVLGRCDDYGATKPAGIKATERVGYHSVSGTEGDMDFLCGDRAQLELQGDWTSAHQELIDKGREYGRQYVVRRSDRVYPAYIVTYTNNPP